MATNNMTRPLNEIALGPHPASVADGIERPGDLDAMQSELEALHTRLMALASRVAYLYGEGAAKGLQSVVSSGKIPRLQATLSDISDILGEIEQTVEKL